MKHRQQTTGAISEGAKTLSNSKVKFKKLTKKHYETYKISAKSIKYL